MSFGWTRLLDKVAHACLIVLGFVVKVVVLAFLGLVVGATWLFILEWLLAR